jgi:starch synthase
MLDWQNNINSLASGIKCSDKVTTVSPSYLEEMSYNSNGLEYLMAGERSKSAGIINGIDTDVWDPQTDTFILKNYSAADVKEGKKRNKQELCNQFNLDIDKPLMVFIGRLVGEKAADVLPDAIRNSIYQHHGGANFLILGSGEPDVEWRLASMQAQFNGYMNTYIGYSESLSHLMYAGADFLLMPSRVEPCGLNQLYALRYGTVPIVRSTGGLRDTVRDFGDFHGYGIRFDHANLADITFSIGRAIDLYTNKKELFNWMRTYMMHIDHSWDASAKEYIRLYESLRSK